jgi:hypothetical protein
MRSINGKEGGAGSEGREIVRNDYRSGEERTNRKMCRALILETYGTMTTLRGLCALLSSPSVPMLPANLEIARLLGVNNNDRKTCTLLSMCDLHASQWR